MKVKNVLFKFSIFLSLIFLSLITFFSVLARELEEDYPTINNFKPTTTETPLPEYVRYIFNFVIVVSGIIALIMIVVGGIEYLTATNKNTVQKSKERIKSAFLGLLILLFSYLILITINPQLIYLQISELQKQDVQQLDDLTSYLMRTDILGRIKDLANDIKSVAPEISSRANKIVNLTGNCNCQNTQSLCVCNGGGPDSNCQAKICYIGPDSNPCPDIDEINKLQQEIVVWYEEINYYGNRMMTDKEDLNYNINEVLDDRISWYEEVIKIKEEELEQMQGREGAVKESQEQIIDSLKEEKKWFECEKSYDEKLIDLLSQLDSIIKNYKSPVEELSQLPNECLTNVNNQCKPSCGGGCHDEIEGCYPNECSGGNPCPMDKINSYFSQIPQDSSINAICDQIIEIINNIEIVKKRGEPLDKICR